MNLYSIDVFSGVGGLTEGMRRAKFRTQIALEIDVNASKAFKRNHLSTKVITKDIREVTIAEIKRKLKNKKIHLLAGCPPCQGFSSVRRLNRSTPIEDERNSLIMEYIRFVKALKPYTIMMENVPGLVNYHLFRKALRVLRNELGYSVDYKIVNVRDYGVPQSRKRLVLVGSRLGEIKVAKPPRVKMVTVRQAIGGMELPGNSKDKLHRIIQINSPEVLEKIRLVPRNGGSRNELPDEYILDCHRNEEIGFRDIYGRLRWDDFSSTITGGCLNASKGRFLHPEQNRTISAREAAILQSFPKKYKFPTNIKKEDLALLIGNALPPKFSYYQSLNIKKHILEHLG